MEGCGCAYTRTVRVLDLWRSGFLPIGRLGVTGVQHDPSDLIFGTDSFGST